jgi:hypothetical protein
MIVVKIELWPHGSEERAKEIGRTYITNDGTGTLKRGNYDAWVCRKDNFLRPTDENASAVREARVEDYPRQSHNVWRLVRRALISAFK